MFWDAAAYLCSFTEGGCPTSPPQPAHVIRLVSNTYILLPLSGSLLINKGWEVSAPEGRAGMQLFLNRTNPIICIRGNLYGSYCQNKYFLQISELWINRLLINLCRRGPGCYYSRMEASVFYFSFLVRFAVWYRANLGGKKKHTPKNLGSCHCHLQCSSKSLRLKILKQFTSLG